MGAGVSVGSFAARVPRDPQTHPSPGSAMAQVVMWTWFMPPIYQVAPRRSCDVRNADPLQGAGSGDWRAPIVTLWFLPHSERSGLPGGSRHPTRVWPGSTRSQRCLILRCDAASATAESSRRSTLLFPLSRHGTAGSSPTTENADRAVLDGFRQFPAVIRVSGDPLLHRAGTLRRTWFEPRGDASPVRSLWDRSAWRRS